MHKHGEKLFKSDLGIWVGLVTCIAWVMNQSMSHQAIDFQGVVTVVGFLMLFFVERSHGREMKAINLKLDELIAAQVGASNRLIRAEDAPEAELNLAHQALQTLAASKDPHEAVSIEQTDFFDEHQLG